MDSISFESASPENPVRVEEGGEKEEEVVECAFCGKRLNHLSPSSRQAHANRCLDAASSSRPDHRCSVCDKDLSGASEKARTHHVKTCARRRAPAPGAPAPGVSRRTSSGAGVRKKVRRKKEEEDELVVGDEEELAQVAVALAASLGQPTVGGNSAGNTNGESVIVLESLQQSGKKNVDLAGFEVASLTQIVEAVAPSPKVPAGVEAMRPSKLAAAGGGKSLWKKASERPLGQTGVYVSGEKRENSPQVESVLQKTPQFEKLVGKSPQFVEKTPLLPVSPLFAAPAPIASSPSTPFAAVAKRQKLNVLEIPSRVEELVRHELSNISNAYSRECAGALQRANDAVAAARQEYYAAIGKSAIERDEKVELLMQRYMLHRGHAESLPMLSYDAVKFPDLPAPLKLPPRPQEVEVIVIREEEEEEEKEEEEKAKRRHDDDENNDGYYDDDRGMDVLADCLEELPSPPKRSRRDSKEKEEMDFESPIIVTAVGRSLDTPSLVLDTPSGAIAPPTPPSAFVTPAKATVASAPVAVAEETEPDWDAMLTEELKDRMTRHGLQVANDAYMRRKLREIWRYQMKSCVTDSLLVARQVQRREIPAGDDVTPMKAGKSKEDAVAVAMEVVEDEGEEEEVADPSSAVVLLPADGEEKNVVVSQSLERDVLAFIKRGPYFERILLFEPFPVMQLLEDLHAARISVTKPQLISFLESKGVDHYDPSSKWGRK